MDTVDRGIVQVLPRQSNFNMLSQQRTIKNVEIISNISQQMFSSWRTTEVRAQKRENTILFFPGQYPIQNSPSVSQLLGTYCSFYTHNGLSPASLILLPNSFLRETVLLPTGQHDVDKTIQQNLLEVLDRNSHGWSIRETFLGCGTGQVTKT